MVPPQCSRANRRCSDGPKNLLEPLVETVERLALIPRLSSNTRGQHFVVGVNRARYELLCLLTIHNSVTGTLPRCVANNL